MKDLLDTFAVCGQLMEDTDPCGCNHTNECSEFAPFPLPSFPEDYAVAMAYIPYQQDAKSYDAEKALARGTLFPGASPIPGYPSKRYAGARYGQTIRQYGFLTR